MTPEVVVAVPPAAARARYALGVLLGLLGLRAREAESGETPDVAYGAHEEARCVIAAGPDEGWDDPAPQVTRVGGLALLHLPGAPAARSDDLADVLYASYACLTAPWERVDPADEVGCPIAAGGFLDRHGLLREPLVHRYAALLGDRLGTDLAGEPALVLTHDVDNNFAHLFARRESMRLLQLDLAARRPAAAARRALGLARRVSRPRSADPNDRFGDWQAWHRGWSSRPTYFFASAGLFHEGGSRRDVPYDVRHPDVRATVRAAAEAGAEIGVHFSIGARESADRLGAERTALEETAGVPVRSARHHWWALGRPPEPTWRGHAEAGITLDCSLGFNDRIGFRRGICVPFRPFDPVSQDALDIHVLPTLAMDAALFDGRPEADALAELRALEGIVRDVRGALVLDWHVHTANPATLPGAAEGLRAFLAETRERGLELRTPLELVG